LDTCLSCSIKCHASIHVQCVAMHGLLQSKPHPTSPPPHAHPSASGPKQQGRRFVLPSPSRQLTAVALPPFQFTASEAQSVTSR
jgi:hypothetical protein